MADYVEITTKKGKIKGTVIPRNEYYKTGFITLKLDNGYDIGIQKKDIVSINKLRDTRLDAASKAKISSKRGLPRVSFLSTGGTIASRVDYLTGGVTSALSPEEMLSSVPELQNIVSVRKVVPVFNMLSEDMSSREWIELAEKVGKELNSGSRGVVISHGTDTMHYTAAALSFMVDSRKPIILTGAQRSPDRGSSDAHSNLICSSWVAGHSDLGETAIVFHEDLNQNKCVAMRGTKTRKMHTERRDAFKPVNSLPLLRVFTNGTIQKMSEYSRYSPARAEVDAVFEKKTALVKAYPGAEPGILKHYIDRKFRGIIIEGTGFGHVPTSPAAKKDSWIPLIKMAVDSGIFVGIVSQALFGRTSSKVYSNLRALSKAGAVHLEDMLPETAYVKLGWVLAHKWNAREKMLENISGEISEKSDFK